MSHFVKPCYNFSINYNFVILLNFIVIMVLLLKQKFFSPSSTSTAMAESDRNGPPSWLICQCHGNLCIRTIPLTFTAKIRQLPPWLAMVLANCQPITTTLQAYYHQHWKLNSPPEKNCSIQLFL